MLGGYGDILPYIVFMRAQSLLLENGGLVPGTEADWRWALSGQDGDKIQRKEESWLPEEPDGCATSCETLTRCGHRGQVALGPMNFGAGRMTWGDGVSHVSHAASLHLSSCRMTYNWS